MTKYERTLEEANRLGLSVKEKELKSNAEALICGKKIAINSKKSLTTNEKNWYITEEIGHHKTGVGNIISQETIENRKQERRGRLYAYNRCIGLTGIINAAKHHCIGSYEIAEFLEVPEARLLEAVEEYRQIYGSGKMIDNYFVQFVPFLAVFEYQLL